MGLDLEKYLFAQESLGIVMGIDRETHRRSARNCMHERIYVYTFLIGGIGLGLPAGVQSQTLVSALRGLSFRAPVDREAAKDGAIDYSSASWLGEPPG